MKRSVLFDTETTGLDPALGDRVIEIAAIELVDDLPTGEVYHALLDPERDVPPESTRVHGFTREDLVGKPKFGDIAQGFLDFIQDDELIAHNAPFDFGFVNAELALCNKPPLHRNRMVDTLIIAKKRFPGLPNNLDALCRRYNIDLSERTTHNALLDCRLLAEVYVELMGGRQRGLGLTVTTGGGRVVKYERNHNRQARLISPPNPIEAEAHRSFITRMKNPLWEK